jgi:hypothetical protein
MSLWVNLLRCKLIMTSIYLLVFYLVSLVGKLWAFCESSSIPFIAQKNHDFYYSKSTDFRGMFSLILHCKKTFFRHNA